MNSRIDERKASVAFFAWCRAMRRYPFVSPVSLSLMFGRGRRSVDWISRAVRHHGFQTSSPLICDRICGGLIENLMMLLIDLGSWRRITYGCACRRRRLNSTSVGVNTIVFWRSSVYHRADGCTESNACSKACVAWDRLSREMAVWF